MKNSNKNIKKITIDEVDDYFALALNLMEDDNNIYRGINTDDQKYPKLIRGIDYSKNEEKFLQEFEKYYGLYSSPLNFWEFVALAQHHGLKTRLIDFTFNIFVATFFALHKASNDGYKVYVMNKNNFSNSSEWLNSDLYVSEPDEKISSDVMLVFKSFENSKHNCILIPNYSNKRIFAQQGLFVVPGILTKEHIDIIYEDADLEITISPHIRDHVLKKLNSIGFNEFRLMPDLDSTCRDINDGIK